MSRLAIALLSSVFLAAAPAKKAADDESTHTLPALAKPFPAPDFMLKGEDGTSYRLSDYRGKVIVLNFWATWCPPCRYEMPSLERAWRKVKNEGVMIMAINMGESEETIWEFTGVYSVSFPIPLDRDGAVIKNYPVVGLPTTYVIDPKGIVTHRAVGTREWDHPQLLDQLRRLLDQ